MNRLLISPPPAGDSSAAGQGGGLEAAAPEPWSWVGLEARSTAPRVPTAGAQRTPHIHTHRLLAVSGGRDTHLCREPGKRPAVSGDAHGRQSTNRTLTQTADLAAKSTGILAT